MRSKKKKGKKEQQGISANTIKVKVYMRFGAEVRQKRAEFTAVEKRDGYNNLVAVNESFDFNEDCDFKQNEVYASLGILFKVKDLQKEDCMNLIQDKIKFHEKRINALLKHPELNKFANVWDEKRRRRELEIFLGYIKNRSDNGSYFKVENGVRVYEYESVDGFLIPIWHGVDNLSDYPDFTSEKKITMQETANLYQYFESKGTKKLLVSTLAVVLVVTVILFGINVYAGFQLMDKTEEVEFRMAESAELCTQQTAQTHRVFTELMQNAFIVEYLEEQKNETTNPNPTNRIMELVDIR